MTTETVEDFSTGAHPAIEQLCEITARSQGGANSLPSVIQMNADRIATARDGTLYLLSVIGYSSSVKSLRSMLASKGAVELVTSGQYATPDKLAKAPGGYNSYVEKLGYGRVHALFISRMGGFMSSVTDAALWQELKSTRYTTPVLREWMKYLRQYLESQQLLNYTKGFQARCGFLSATTDDLDDAVKLGLATGAIRVPFATPGSSGLTGLGACSGLDEFFAAYSGVLTKSAEEQLRPLHVPGTDPLALDMRPYRQGGTFLRTPFDPQAHVITATTKVLDRQNLAWIIGECGTGKTFMGMAAAHVNAKGRPYRGLVMCPDHLQMKWSRELRKTIPNVKVVRLETWRDVLKLVPETEPFQSKRWAEPTAPTWYVIGRDRSKLGLAWKSRVTEKALYYRSDDGVARKQIVAACPKCGTIVIDKKTLAPMHPDDLPKNRQLLRCKGQIEVLTGEGDEQPEMAERICGAVLYEYQGKPNYRYAPERIIATKLKSFFDYMIIDEVHEMKSAETAQATAMGAMAAVSKRVICMTGTLIGGYANHLFPLTYRLAPRTLVQEGFEWSDSMNFSRAYGRIDKVITEKCERYGESNTNSRGGGGRKVAERPAPGIMPSLFGRHVMDKAVFLSLDQLSCNLPPLDEQVVGIPMDDELTGAYQDVSSALESELKGMVARGDTRLLGSYLETLLYYPDHPFGWPMIGYTDKNTDQFVPVVKPKDIGNDIREKEATIALWCADEVNEGNQVWLFVQRTGDRDMLVRMKGALERMGLRVGILRSSVERQKREEWIAKNGRNFDVCLSHPQLVETGLDLFSLEPGTHNFSSLGFVQTGYRTFTTRQASRRAWRISQKKRCKIRYFYYENSMQESAIKLMGLKLRASLGIEGKFSEEGLAAMNEGSSSDTLDLARMVTRKSTHSVADLWTRDNSMFADPIASTEPLIPAVSHQPEQGSFAF